MIDENNKKFHKELNPKIWEFWKEKRIGGRSGYDLKLPVYHVLKNIANAFIEFLDIPKNAVKDIVLTGSNVSYNYTPQSDLDVHLIVDFEKVHKDCPIVSGFMQSKKSEFNNSHDIYIYGIPVEVYVEPINAPSVYNGLYSLKYHKWLKKPEKLKPLNNSADIKAKYEEIKNTIDDLLDESKFLRDEVADGETAEKLMKKLKQMRMAGLQKEGEFSVENQVFKKLRNEGYIGKLVNMRKKGEDKKLSLEEKYEDIMLDIEEMLGTSTAVMAPYPTPVAGQNGVYKERKGKTKPAMYKYKYQKTRGKKMKTIVETMEKIYNTCEAILDESTLQAIRKSNLPKEKKQELTGKLGKARAKEEELANEKAFQSWVKGERKQPTVETARSPEYTKNANGERETRLRSYNNNYNKYGYSKPKTDSQKIDASIQRNKKKINKAYESIEEITFLCNKILEEKDGYNLIATGHYEGDGNNLYKVHTKHDKGITKSKIYAKDPDHAKKLVQKMYGGPDSAHEVIE